MIKGPMDFSIGSFIIKHNTTIVVFCFNSTLSHFFYVNLYKEYTSLKSRELEELPRFQVMSWQPF